MKTIHMHITVWLILLVGGFLLGYVPEYLKNRQLQTELEGPQKTIDRLKLQIELGEVRDAASLALLEVSRQNYGLARDHANTYYNKINDLISNTKDENLKKALSELSATGQSFISNLATATPSSLTAVQPLVFRTFEVTKDLGKQ